MYIVCSCHNSKLLFIIIFVIGEQGDIISSACVKGLINKISEVPVNLITYTCSCVNYPGINCMLS